MKRKVKLILLVDDDVDDNFFHRRAIEKAGIAEHIVECLDGIEALEFLKQEGKWKKEGNSYPQPDLIFLDINMPRLNGWEFLAAYEQLPSNIKGGIIITMLTTSLNPQDKEKAKQFDSVNDFRIKPLTSDMLIDIIEKYFA